MMPKLRLMCQITVFVGIILVTYLNHYENQKVKYGGHYIINQSMVLRTIDKLVGQWDSRSEFTTFIQGDVWAAQFGRIKIVDPLAFVGNLARTKKVYGLLLGAAFISTALTLLLGKVFCSWICPMGLLFEINDKLRKFLIKKGVPLFNVTIPRGVKYFVLVGGLLSGLIFGAHYFFVIYPPKLVSGEIYFWITRSGFSFGLLIIFAYLAIELLFAPRLWCRSLCPGGAVYTLINKFRFVRIKNDLKNCTNCGICDKLCPYDINPSKGHLSAECDHCSICISKCPVDTLSFIVGKDREVMPPHKIRADKSKGQNKHPVTAAVVLLSLLFFPGHAQAHHIRGLPHHGYSSNYPQTPNYEEYRVVDDWNINFSFIRIFETKNCDLAVYIKNNKTGKPFQGVVTFLVFGEREAPEKNHPFDANLDPTNTYRVGWVYEKDGIYILRIKFHDGQHEYIEDFRMQMGNVGFRWGWLILPGAVILILVLMVVLKRKKAA